MTPSEADATRLRLAELCSHYALPPGTADCLLSLLERVRDSPHGLTTVRDPAAAVDVHVADSLTGLEVDEVRSASVLADLGSGAGFPGLVLALALPTTSVVLVESVGKKAAFLEESVQALDIPNAEVVGDRAETWTAGEGACDVVTARALAPLAVLLEYAAPLLRAGGSLVAWKGRRDAAEEATANSAAPALGMRAPMAIPVLGPVGAARHLYLSRKVGLTPAGFPRRPGMARKHPLGGSG